MDLSYTTNFKNEIDIPVRIGHIDWTIHLDEGFFLPAAEDYAGLHNHFTYEIYFVLTGSSVLFVHQQFYALSAGDICILSPGVYHYHHEKPCEHFEMITVKLIAPAMKKKEGSLPSQEAEEVLKALTDIKFAVLKDSFGSQNLLCEILRELEEKPMGFYTNVQALFTQIIIKLTRSVAQSSLPVSIVQDRMPEEIRNEIIDGFFYHNYHQSVTADDLAHLVNMSRRQLYRILKRLYNLSFKQKLLETRVEVAKDLLQHSDLPVHSIAEKVGYLMPANFYTVFKQRTGITPDWYRQINRHDSSAADL